jgi:hypothetical protein
MLDLLKTAQQAVLSLPLVVHAVLSSNPKTIEDFPNLDSHLDAVVAADGTFTVTSFELGAQAMRPNQSMELTPGRRTIQLYKVSISELAATVALVRRRSSCSR